jgi:hypothetical protein
MVSIAEQYGFFWETVWNFPANAGLRSKRRDPMVLLPGDEVVIPDKRVREESRPIGKKHTFRVKNVPAKFKLKLLDASGAARAGLPFVLTVDGVETAGKTAGDGSISVPIAPGASRAVLSVGEDGSETYAFDLGGIDPVDTDGGARARLRNLGFLTATVGSLDDVAAVEAVCAFQRAQGIEPSGKMDDATRSKLVERHGC